MIPILGERPATAERPGDLWVPGGDDVPDRVPEDWAREFEVEKQRVERYRYRMANNVSNSWVGLNNSNSQGASGTSFTGTTITDISPAPDFTMPAGVPAGTILRLTAKGQYVVSGSATNLTLQFMYGGTGGTSLFTTGAVAMTTSATNIFRIETIVRVLTTGSSGTFCAVGLQQGVSTTANIGVPVQVITTSATINTLTANTVIVTGTSSAALTSCIVYLFLVEQLN